MTEPWSFNLPDWTDIAAYPVADGTADGAWGWEFLRRNPLYQQVFAACQSNPRSARRVRAQRFHVSEMVDPNCHFDQELVDRITGRKSECCPMFDQYRPELISLPIDADHFQIASIVQRRIATPSKKKAPEDFREEVLTVKFDLTQDLNAQLKVCEERLRAEQSRFRQPGAEFRARRMIYQRYLRLLDAETKGVKHSEIIRTLWPNKPTDSCELTTLNDQLVAARELRDTSYAHLLFR
jgi:hypothetical protein